MKWTAKIEGKYRNVSNYPYNPLCIKSYKRRSELIPLTYFTYFRRIHSMQIKKSVFVSSLVACSLAFGAVGAVASNGIEKVTASLNHNIKFLLDGKTWKPKDANGKELSALVYKGSTYVPLRAVGNALGAEVDYDGDKLIITIDSSGDDGIPHLDDSDGNNNSSSTDIPTSSGGVMTFPANFDTEKVAVGQLKQHAISLIKMYGAALENGDYSDFEKYIDNNAAIETDDSWVMGRDYSKEKFAALIEGSIEANDAETIADFASDIQKVQAEEIEVSSSYKSEYSATISFKYEPEGWNAFSTVYVYFEFEKLDDGTYVLDYVYLS